MAFHENVLTDKNEKIGRDVITVLSCCCCSEFSTNTFQRKKEREGASGTEGGWAVLLWTFSISYTQQQLPLTSLCLLSGPSVWTHTALFIIKPQINTNNKLHSVYHLLYNFSFGQKSTINVVHMTFY